MATTERTLSVHQEHELLLAFEKAGIDSDLAQAVIGNPDNELAKWVIAQIKEKLGLSFLFTSLGEQRGNIIRWNLERGMDFTEAELTAIDITPSGEQSLRRAELLVPVSADMETNQEAVVDQLWFLSQEPQPNCWRNPDLVATPDDLHPIPGTKVYERGIHRVVVDLAANWEPQGGRTLLEVDQRPLQPGQSPAAAELLAAAAHFPKWVQAMDGVTVPYVDLWGFRFRLNTEDDSPEAWSYCPCLGWWAGSRELRFILGSVGYRGSEWAAPVVQGVLA